MMPPDTASRLIRVLGMLGSAHEGERAAAGLMAHRIVSRAGLTWEDALAPLLAQKAEEPSVEAFEGFGDFKCAVTFCLANSAKISEWDFEFLNSLRRFKKISTKQRAVLARIVSKCEAASR